MKIIYKYALYTVPLKSQPMLPNPVNVSITSEKKRSITGNDAPAPREPIVPIAIINQSILSA